MLYDSVKMQLCWMEVSLKCSELLLFFCVECKSFSVRRDVCDKRPIDANIQRIYLLSFKELSFNILETRNSHDDSRTEKQPVQTTQGT